MASQITGAKELARKLDAMARAPAGKALRDSVFFATGPTVAKAKHNIPVGNPPYESWDGKDPYAGPHALKTYKGRLRTPGFAKRNIARRSFVSKDKKYVMVRIGVRSEAFYAINFIEFGTSKIPKTPWLRPALEHSIPQIDQRLKSKLKQLIDKASRVR